MKQTSWAWNLRSKVAFAAVADVSMDCCCLFEVFVASSCCCFDVILEMNWSCGVTSLGLSWTSMVTASPFALGTSRVVREARPFFTFAFTFGHVINLIKDQNHAMVSLPSFQMSCRVNHKINLLLHSWLNCLSSLRAFHHSVTATELPNHACNWS